MWKIVDGEKQLTTECIENVFLMMPFTAIVMWTFEVKKNVVWKGIKIAFLFSVMIELLQLLLRLGTFQISDIVYNTVGGMLGGILYVGVKQLMKRGDHIGKTKFL